MLKLIVGCYEQMLLGYSITKQEDEEKSTSKLKAELIFTDHSHTGCIRTVACSDSFMASGATDETIYIFNIKDNKEVGSLQGHEGTITQLRFPDNNYLLSASSDGAINVWRVSSKWDKAKCLRGHKGPVSGFDVHPSGKLALSVSPKDGSLRTWNMISGRPVYVKNMKKFSPELVKFSPGEGEYYAVASNNAVQIYELKTADLIKEIDWRKLGKILSIEFVTENLLAVTGEGKVVHIYRAKDGKLLSKFEAHTSRVKALQSIRISANLLEGQESCVVLASASSDGHVKVWNIDEDVLLDEKSSVLKAPKCILDIDTKARVTCLSFWNGEG